MKVENKVAKPAFNVFDLDTIRAVYDAAVETNKEIYIQFSSSTVKYYGAKLLASMVNEVCTRNRHLIIVHLDHCTDLDLIQSCIENGWDSVMGDFSHLELDENIANMLKIKQLIGDKNVAVEGELGQVSGVEDGHGSEGGSFVSPDDVTRFVNETEVDLLAIGIGNAHGFYKSTSGIRINLLRDVHELIPSQKLVLHGGTGIELEKINEMKNYGIHKINVSTELKDVYLKASLAHENSDKKYDMIALVEARYQAVKSLAKQRTLEFS